MRSAYSRKKCFLICSLIIALLCITDMTMGYFELKPMRKIYVKIRTQHPYYHHDLKPCKSSYFEEMGNGYGYALTTNSLGFRDSLTRQVPLQTEKKRILFIGDSFTEGAFVPYESTFAGQIARARPDLDILNAGVSTYSPLMYYLKIDYLLNKTKLTFDELFVFIDMSDIQDEYVYKDLEHFKPSHEASFFNDLIFRIERFFYNHSYTYNVFRQVVKTRSERLRRLGETEMWTFNQHILDKYNLKIREEHVQEWSKKGLVYAVDNMQRLVNLCKKNNIPLTIVVYPWEIQVFVRDMPSRQQLIWSSFAAKNGVGFLDLFPVFINNAPPETVIKKYFLPGDFHWNESGHALVAHEVLNYMEKNRKIKN